MPTALVTGPTAGIGNAFARALAARGFDLVLVSRDTGRLDTLAGELAKEHGVSATVLAADLGDREALARVEQRLSDADHPIDLLVNNAGFALGSGFLASTADEEEKLVNVHVRAVLRLSKAAVDVMVSRGHGWIINVASVAAFAPYGTYGAAKAWVTSFSEGLDGELAGTGVRAVACCPGYVRTEFHERAGMSMTKLPEIAWLDADNVVAETLRRLERGSPVIVPTMRYRLVAGLARHAPRAVVGAVARRMRGGR